MSELSSDYADAKERIAELERENTALRHELTAIRNTLEAVGREKDELAPDAARWREFRDKLPITFNFACDLIDAAIAKQKEAT